MSLWPAGWLGVDPGAIGAALLYGALLMFVALLTRNPESVFPEESSFTERQSWVSLIFSVLIAFRFLDLLLMLPAMGAEGEPLYDPASRQFGISLGVLIAGWAVTRGLLRSKAVGSIEPDERDMRIQLDAGRVASGLMRVMLVASIAMLVLLPEHSRAWMRPLVLANGIIALLLVRALAEHTGMVLRYWRARA